MIRCLWFRLLDALFGRMEEFEFKGSTVPETCTSCAVPERCADCPGSTERSFHLKEEE